VDSGVSKDGTERTTGLVTISGGGRDNECAGLTPRCQPTGGIAPFGGAQGNSEGCSPLAAPLAEHIDQTRTQSLVAGSPYWIGLPPLHTFSSHVTAVPTTVFVKTVPEVLVAKNRMLVSIGTALAK